VRGRVSFVDTPTPAPARNVIAVLPGTDPALRGEYVAIGAHNDHVGYVAEAVDHDSLRVYNRLVRPGGAESPPRPATAQEEAIAREALAALRGIRPVRPDSISNGADDDGSGTVGVLEIAEALAADPPGRSVLFVWHTAEEMGLLGAEWFTDHPTVPREAIVAQLNIDMIGRNSEDDPAQSNTVLLVGSDRISTELHNLSEDANQSLDPPLTLDYTMNDPADLEQVYYRSDHYSYAAKGVPIIFYTTGLHPDYHANSDEVDKIEFGKMARIARLVYVTGEQVANLDHAPARDNRGPRVGKGSHGKLPPK
jgi:hypothetical protein